MNKDDKLLSFRTETSVLGTIMTETASYDDRRPYGWEGIEHWMVVSQYSWYIENSIKEKVVDKGPNNSFMKLFRFGEANGFSAKPFDASS